MEASSQEARQRRRARIRKRVRGVAGRPRLCVVRSDRHIYAQVIDDASQNTLCAASTLDKDLRTSLTTGGTCDASVAVGELVARPRTGFPGRRALVQSAQR